MAKKYKKRAPRRRPALSAGRDWFHDWLGDVRTSQAYADFADGRAEFPDLPQPGFGDEEGRSIVERVHDRSYYERWRVLTEIHGRAGFPLKRYARVTHMARVFRSVEDLLRTRLRVTLMRQFNRALKSANEHGIILDETETPREEELIDRLIRSIAPSYFREASRETELETRDAAAPTFEDIRKALDEYDQSDPIFARRERRRLLSEQYQAIYRDVLRRLPNQLRRMVKRWGGAELLQVAEVAMDRLKQALRPKGRIYRKTPKKQRRYIEIRADQKVGNHACWLRFPDRRLRKHHKGKAIKAAYSASKRLNTLRVNWQLFSLSQDFTFFEDFDDPALAEAACKNTPRKARFFKKSRTKSESRELNTDWTALDSFEDRLKEYDLLAAWGRSKMTPASTGLQDDAKFFWSGRLLVLSNFWVIPWQDAIGVDAHGDLPTRFTHFDAESLPGAPVDGAASSEAAKERLSPTARALRDFVLNTWVAYAPPDRARPNERVARAREVSEALADFAIKRFNRWDRSRRECTRADLIMSRFAGGRAIGIADLRPHSRVGPEGKEETGITEPEYDPDDSRWGENASRAIIVDFGLNDEQRGRAIKRFCDIATFRLLGLRDAQYFDAINDTLNALGIEIAQLSATIGKSADFGEIEQPSSWDKTIGRRPQAFLMRRIRALRNRPLRRKRRHDREQALKNADSDVRRIAADLASLNHFVTYGIGGRSLSTENYRQAIKECCDDLRESRVPDFPPVTEYLDRFQVSADKIRRVSARYATLRAQLAEVAAIINTQSNLQQLDQLNKAARAHSWFMVSAVVVTSIAAWIAWSTRDFQSGVEARLADVKAVIDLLLETNSETNAILESMRDDLAQSNDAARSEDQGVATTEVPPPGDDQLDDQPD